MSERKHTPGPWDAYTGIHDETQAAFVARTEDMLVVARIPPYETDEAHANAHLIAAAPDLMEALEGLGVLPDGYCFCFGSRRDALKPEHEHTGECRAARAALIRARNES